MPHPPIQQVIDLECHGIERVGKYFYERSIKEHDVEDKNLPNRQQVMLGLHIALMETDEKIGRACRREEYMRRPEDEIYNTTKRAFGHFMQWKANANATQYYHSADLRMIVPTDLVHTIETFGEFLIKYCCMHASDDPLLSLAAAIDMIEQLLILQAKWFGIENPGRLNLDAMPDPRETYKEVVRMVLFHIIQVRAKNALDTVPGPNEHANSRE